MGQKIITLSGAATDVLYALFSVVRCKVASCHLNLVQHSFASWGWLKPDSQQQPMGR
ncbi:hypothetical protein [Enterobacter sichuanensis]|uniref:hypothetical protein n=1 Tax=Enterobacter sichuanensis TaxID=2071710 RepID=UPI0038905E20